MAWFNKKREARGTDVVFYEGMDILEMSRNALKKALQIKELDTSGSKKMLRLRLMESVQREMEEEQAYRAAVLAARRAEAALEESGSVCVGLLRWWGLPPYARRSCGVSDVLRVRIG